MRIGFDAKRAFLNRSGLGNYSRDIIRSLHQQFPENEYLLYTPRIDAYIFPGADKKYKLSTAPASYGRLRQSLWRSNKITDLAVADTLDIYHGLSNELPNNIQKSGVKSIVTIHDLIFMRYPEWYPIIDRAIYRKKFKSSSQIANRIITVSQQTKNDLLDFFGIEQEKVKVIYQGCHEAFQRILSPEEISRTKLSWKLPNEYMLYVGTIEERKNLLNLVKAIHQRNLQMPLVVVGRPTPYLKKVQQYIRMSRLKNIQFLKEVSVEDLPGIYQGAKLFVYPSVFEGFGIPVLEAMVSGVPVITSRGGCFAEVGGKSTIYIDPKNIEEIGEELARVLSDSSLREKMVDDGKLHAKIFSNQTIARQVMELYKEVSHA